MRQQFQINLFIFKEKLKAVGKNIEGFGGQASEYT